MMAITRRNSLRVRLKIMKKPLTAVSILVIAALTLGVAVAQRMEHRAQQDRFSFGESATHAAQ